MKRLRITFGPEKNVSSPSEDSITYSFPFRAVDAKLHNTPEEKGASKLYRMIVCASRTRLAGWKLSNNDLIKVLFWFARRHIEEVMNNSVLNETMRMPMVTTETHPNKCPLNPELIPNPNGYVFIANLPEQSFSEKHMKTKIFISYAKPDLAPARAIVRFLKAAGFATWFDEDDLHAGQNWELTIKSAIQNSSLLLTCLSSQSVDRTGFFQKEMRLAFEQADKRPESKVFILPVKLNPCVIPESISTWHAMNLYTPRGTDKLLSAIASATNEGARAPVSEHEELFNTIQQYNRTNPGSENS